MSDLPETKPMTDSLREEIERRMQRYVHSPLNTIDGEAPDFIMLRNAVAVAKEMIEERNRLIEACHKTIENEMKRAGAAEKGLAAHHGAMGVTEKRPCSHCKEFVPIYEQTVDKLVSVVKERDEARRALAERDQLWCQALVESQPGVIADAIVAYFNGLQLAPKEEKAGE